MTPPDPAPSPAAPGTLTDLPQDPAADREAAQRSERFPAREYLEAFLIAVLFATFARTYVVQAFKIPSGSMEQNLLVGDHILVNKFIYGRGERDWERRFLPRRPVARGDVVVFKYPVDPRRDFIKRCMALPGDTVEIRNKDLYVNERLVADDAYTFHLDRRTYPPALFLEDSYRFRDNYGPYTVPPAHYFFLGDNRDHSNDSRFWGPVPESYVKGRALLIYWSFAGEPEPLAWPGLVGRIEQFLGRAGQFFTHTRWERTLRLVR